MKRNREKALICADVLVNNKYLKGVFGENKPRFKTAILAFLPMYGMTEKFCGSKGREVPMSRYWNTWVRDDGLMLAGPVFGGPMCAVIMEEMAACGVENFIGYGASGTMDASVPPCSIMVADSGLNSDGTTKEYTRKREITGDPELLTTLRDAISRRGVPVFSGKVWTTDAIYREFPSTVTSWKNKGARFVNMETTTFYAAAEALGVKAAYLSAVSDNVSGEKWSGWHPDFDTPLEQMQDICLEVAETI